MLYLMQSDCKKIYQLTAQKTGKSEQFYKDVGGFVFSCLYSRLRRPKSLIIKLKGVGRWYLRKKRMEIFMRYFNPLLNIETTNPVTLIRHENRLEISKLFEQRLKEYEKYIEQRDETRKKRYKTQYIIPPIPRDEKSS